MKKTHSEIRQLDKILTLLLILMFVPISIWGGIESWAGATDYLVLVLMGLGAAYAVLIGARTKSPLLGTLAGIIAGICMYVPSTFFYVREDDVSGFIVMMVIISMLGLFSSLISKKRYKRKMLMAYQPDISPAVESQDPAIQGTSENYAGKMLWGLLLAIGGVVFSALSYNAASSAGGTYFVAWGVILYGIVDFFTGLVGFLNRHKSS